jgi:hypothetical protein
MTINTPGGDALEDCELDTAIHNHSGSWHHQLTDMQFQMQVLYKIKLVSSKIIFSVKITGAFSNNVHLTNIKTMRQYIYVSQEMSHSWYMQKDDANKINLVADHCNYCFQEQECYSSLVWDSYDLNASHLLLSHQLQ